MPLLPCISWAERPPPHPPFPSLPIHEQQEHPSAWNPVFLTNPQAPGEKSLGFSSPEGPAQFLAPANAQSSLPNDGMMDGRLLRATPSWPCSACCRDAPRSSPPPPRPRNRHLSGSHAGSLAESSTWLAGPNLTANETLRGRKDFKNQEKNEP